MNLLPFDGLIIPGLHFDSCTIWVLKWTTNPTPFNGMVEVWILWHDGKKTCYISPSEADIVLKKYHKFDEIIPANILISETKLNIQIDVTVNNVTVLSLMLSRRKALKYSLINLILKYGNKDKIAEKGKTETGMNYKSIPKKIALLAITKAELHGKNMKHIKKAPIQYTLGDGQSAKEPIINYCTHMLED